MTNSFEIKQYDFYHQLEILPFVEKILLFGSRARQDNRQKSDIDIAISCPEATDIDWLKVVDIIDDADTLLKIDCVRLDDLLQESSLKQNIEKEGVVLYVKN